MNIYRRILNKNIYHDNINVDKNTLSSTTRIQNKINEQNRDDKIDLI